MNAQRLYELREETGFCDGQTLHRFFETMTGNPSPAGRTRINTEAAQAFYDAEVAQRVANGCRREDFPATL